MQKKTINANSLKQAAHQKWMCITVIVPENPFSSRKKVIHRLFCNYIIINCKNLDRKRAPRISRINRIGFQCSAFAHVTKISENEFQVKACLTHYGHDLEVKHARISSSLRQDIVRYIENGRSVDWIINQCEYTIDFVILNNFEEIS